MNMKLLIPLYGDEIAPRFDLATEVSIVTMDEREKSREEKIIVLPRVSAEHLCHLILTEGVQVVICGGIEEEYYQYLTWKRIKVYDSVIGSWHTAVARYIDGTLQPGNILQNNQEQQNAG